jgi:hypothetical protein
MAKNRREKPRWQCLMGRIGSQKIFANMAFERWMSMQTVVRDGVVN